MAQGDYHPVALPSSRGEFGQLASTFNQMVANIQDREQKITFQAEHDAETGLPNLRKLHADLESYLAGGGRTASAVVVAVERVNEVRNTFGFATWERLIAQIAPRLRDSAPHSALLARVSKFTEIPVDQLNQRLKPKPGSRFAGASPASTAAAFRQQSGDAGATPAENSPPPRPDASWTCGCRPPATAASSATRTCSCSPCTTGAMSPARQWRSA